MPNWPRQNDPWQKWAVEISPLLLHLLNQAMVGELLPAVSSRGMIQNLNLDSTKLKVQGTWASGRLEEYVVLMCLYMHSCIYKCSQCPWQLLNSKAGCCNKACTWRRHTWTWPWHSTSVLGNDLDETSSGARFSEGKPHGWTNMHGTENNMFSDHPLHPLMWPAFSGLLCKFQRYPIWEKNTSCSWVATRVCDSWTWSCHLWHRRGSQRGGTWAGIRHIEIPTG